MSLQLTFKPASSIEANHRTDPTLTMVDRKDLFKVSFSQIASWQHCQQAWHYNYMENLVPQQTATYLKRGTLVHELLSVVDQLMGQGVKTSESAILWDSILEFCELELAMNIPYADLELYHRALTVCKRYVYEFLPLVDSTSRVLATEDGFELEFETTKGRHILFNGYIDRTHLEDGRLWILDRKTSATGKHWSDNMIEMDPQLLLYNLALREIARLVGGLDPFGVMVDSISTYPYSKYEEQPLGKVFKRLRSYRTPKEIDFAFKNYLRIVDQIFDHVASGEDPIRTLSRNCPMCKYVRLCQYEMKGIDTSTLRMEEFKVKPTGELGSTQRAIDAQLQRTSQST